MYQPTKVKKDSRLEFPYYSVESKEVIMSRGLLRVSVQPQIIETVSLFIRTMHFCSLHVI